MPSQERTISITRLPEFRPALLRMASYLTRDSAAAEDLVQATLLSAIEHFDSWEGRGSLKNWLFRILANQNHRRGRNREMAVDDATWGQLAAAAGWAADADLDRGERIETVQQAILQLSEADRELLLLRDVEGIEGDEAADILGLTLAAMKSRLHRARLRLLSAVKEVSTARLQHRRFDRTMSCMEVVQCLGDYADGCLEAAAVAAIDSHLKHCDRCLLFSRRYAKLLGQLPGIRCINDQIG